MDILRKYGLLKEDYFYYGQWTQPPLASYFWAHWHNSALLERYGLIGLTPNEIAGNYFIPNKSNLRKIKNLLICAIKNQDDKFAKNLLRISNSIFDSSLKEIDKLADKEVSPESFEELLEAILPIMVPWVISVILSDDLGRILITTAKKYGFDDNEIINHIPRKASLLTKQHQEAMQIKKILVNKRLIGGPLFEIKNNYKIWRKIEKHVNKYQWVGTHNLEGEPFSVEKLLDGIISLKAIKRPLKPRDKFPAELAYLMSISKEISYLRQYAAEISSVIFLKARPYLEKLAVKLNLNYTELLMMVPAEIIKSLKGKLRNLKSIGEKRRKGYFYLFFDGRDTIIDNAAEVKNLTKIFLPEINYSGKIIKGIVASRGYAKGRTKIIFGASGFYKMEKGDILVATMTTPDFVPLMKKAAAIITDIGGLLSHAAIVSRELGIPCIIGTKIATKVLKDGDLVEVDANKGIVRIIKRVGKE